MFFCIRKPLPVLALLSLFVLNAFSQSIDQDHPTPVSENRISGLINARDIGDPRLTTLFYILDGRRGDVFLDLTTDNFSGDVDVFLLDGLKPRTKITVYAESSEKRRGRVIYLRKPEKLLVRIQGRSPNDLPAKYEISFGGSFALLEPADDLPDSELAKADSLGEGAIRVNSVGTIIEEPEDKAIGVEKREVDAKTGEELVVEAESNVVTTVTDGTPTKLPEDLSFKDLLELGAKDSSVETKSEKSDEGAKPTEKKDKGSGEFDPRKTDEDVIREAGRKLRPRVVITDPFADPPAEAKAKEDETIDVLVDTRKKSGKRSALVTIERVSDEVAAPDIGTIEERKALALEKFRLVVRFTNGEKFEKQLKDVVSFMVIDGELTIVTTIGELKKFSIVKIESVKIEQPVQN